MKKLKQITALIGVIALAGLYVSTLVLALNVPRIRSPALCAVFAASVFSTEGWNFL